ncbi:hypothetical protein U1Q18_042604 [Sarracenia purpurea var. burkii]
MGILLHRLPNPSRFGQVRSDKEAFRGEGDTCGVRREGRGGSEECGRDNGGDLAHHPFRLGGEGKEIYAESNEDEQASTSLPPLPQPPPPPSSPCRPPPSKNPPHAGAHLTVYSFAKLIWKMIRMIRVNFDA